MKEVINVSPASIPRVLNPIASDANRNPEIVRKQILELALQHNLNIVSLQSEDQSLEDMFRLLPKKLNNILISPWSTIKNSYTTAGTINQYSFKILNIHQS